MDTPSLDQLWNGSTAHGPLLQRERLVTLPDPARRYLEHAMAPAAPPASAVRLRMHGQIKLQRWLPFTADQVIRWDRGFIWSATIRRGIFSIRGFDRFLDGKGALQWKLLGIWPLVRGVGPDITRSAAGRLQAESVWLPSVFAGDEASWTATGPSQVRAHITVQGHPATLDFAVDDVGRLTGVQLPRWGNPEGGAFHEVPFGAIVEEERTFQGYTIPARLRVGWYAGTDRFADEGEFFRATIDDAKYR